jgi:hypothetical protein
MTILDFDQAPDFDSSSYTFDGAEYVPSAVEILNVAAIREAIASDARAARGVTEAFDYVPTTVTPRQLPAVIVGNPSIDYGRTTGRGHATLTIPVFCLVAERGDAEAGTRALDLFVSQLAEDTDPATLAWAIRQGRSTDDRPWTVRVVDAAEYELLSVDGTEYLSVTITTEIRT